MVTFLVITIDLDDFYHVMGAVNTLFLNKSNLNHLKNEKKYGKCGPHDTLFASGPFGSFILQRYNIRNTGHCISDIGSGLLSDQLCRFLSFIRSFWYTYV